MDKLFAFPSALVDAHILLRRSLNGLMRDEKCTAGLTASGGAIEEGPVAK